MVDLLVKVAGESLIGAFGGLYRWCIKGLFEVVLGWASFGRSLEIPTRFCSSFKAGISFYSAQTIWIVLGTKGAEEAKDLTKMSPIQSCLTTGSTTTNSWTTFLTMFDRGMLPFWGPKQPKMSQDSSQNNSKKGAMAEPGFLMHFIFFIAISGATASPKEI